MPSVIPQVAVPIKESYRIKNKFDYPSIQIAKSMIKLPCVAKGTTTYC